jgi:hypothetical protein
MKFAFNAVEPLELLATAGRDDCVELRPARADYYVRAFPGRRTRRRALPSSTKPTPTTEPVSLDDGTRRWQLELVRNRYYVRARDALDSQRRRTQIERLGWDFAAGDLSPDARAGLTLTGARSDEVLATVVATLDRFGDHLDDVEIEPRQRRREGWPDVPFVLSSWDHRENPRFAALGEGVRRLEGRGRHYRRVFWTLPDTGSDDYAYLLSTAWFSEAEATDLWFDTIDECRIGLDCGDIFYRC